MSETLSEWKERLQKIRGPGKHFFLYCPICGFVQWTSSRRKDPDEVVLEESESNANCPECQEIIQRYPELQPWIVNVVNWTAEKQRIFKQ